MAQIVQRLHTVDVQIDALFTEKSRHLRVAPAPLVTGNIKGDHPHLPKPLQRFIDGSAALVQSRLLHRLILPSHDRPKREKTQAVRAHIPALEYLSEKGPGYGEPQKNPIRAWFLSKVNG